MLVSGRVYQGQKGFQQGEGGSHQLVVEFWLNTLGGTGVRRIHVDTLICFWYPTWMSQEVDNWFGTWAIKHACNPDVLCTPLFK